MTFKRETVIALSIAGSLHIGVVVALTLSTPPEPATMALDHGFEMVELAPLEKRSNPSTPLINKIKTTEVDEPSTTEPVVVAEVEVEPAPAPEAVIPEVAKLAEQPQPEVAAVAMQEPEAEPLEAQPETPPVTHPARKVLTAEQARALPLMLASIDDIYIPPVSHSRYLHNPKARYPRIAEKRGMEGLVMINVHVGRDGRPIEALIHTSSGYGVLDRAALKAVRSWRFEAARRGNTRVEGQVLVPINFELTEKG
ncbi:MAG: energy transducer TonB [Thiotrichaceae bacterium]|nr:energy transducer TonB [Thiotrichaceae bacterium]